MMQTIPTDIKVGVRVQVLGKLMGTVKFAGVTKFAAGPWVGVELDAPEGKNDGTVQGERYFDCKPGHGIFARPNSVRPEPALNAFAMPGEMPQTPESAQEAPGSPDSPAQSAPSINWTRRQSAEHDLRQDICVDERVDLMSILGDCADDVQAMTEAVDKLAASMQAAPVATASEKLSPEEEAWLSDFTEQFERKFEEKLVALLDAKVSALVKDIPST